MAAGVTATTRCLVPGCTNAVVRVLVHQGDQAVRGGLCAFHVERAILYLPDEQVRSLVFPTLDEQGLPAT